MKHIMRTMALPGALAALGAGAFAQDADPATMTCTDFMALSADQQMQVMSTLRTAAATPGETASPAAGGADAAGASGSGGMDTGTSAVGTAPAGGDSPSTGTDTAASPEAGEALSTDPDIAAVLANCQGHEESLVTERMTAM